MRFSTFAFATAPVLALALTSAMPAEAQSRYYDQRRSDNSSDIFVGLAIGALAGALIASAASDDDDQYRRSGCALYRDGRCYRNQGHWERDNGINSRDGAYDRDYRQEGREYRRDRRDDRRDYRYDRRW